MYMVPNTAMQTQTHLQNILWGGGGGWNAIRYQILDPPKNQISDPPKKNQI